MLCGGECKVKLSYLGDAESLQKQQQLFSIILYKPASWWSSKALVSGAGGLRFKYRAGQIGRSVANGLPPLKHFFDRSCVARAQ